jgi:hypothetical protein
MFGLLSHWEVFNKKNTHLKGHKHGKVCQSKTLVKFLESIHKIWLNILKLKALANVLESIHKIYLNILNS